MDVILSGRHSHDDQRGSGISPELDKKSHHFVAKQMTSFTSSESMLLSPRTVYTTNVQASNSSSNSTADGNAALQVDLAVGSWIGSYLKLFVNPTTGIRKSSPSICPPFTIKVF